MPGGASRFSWACSRTAAAGLVLEPRFDLRVLAFTAAVAVVTGLLFSVLPALHATRVDAAKPADSARTSTPGVRLRVGQALVVTQVTLSLVLLCGAALFLRTLHNLTTLESGFNREGVLTMQVDAVLPPTKLVPRTPAVRARIRAGRQNVGGSRRSRGLAARRHDRRGRRRSAR